MFCLHSERSALIFLRGLWWWPWCGGGGRDGESEREIEKERSSDLSVALSPLSRLFFVSPSLLSLMAVVAGVVCVCGVVCEGGLPTLAPTTTPDPALQTGFYRVSANGQTQGRSGPGAHTLRKGSI